VWTWTAICADTTLIPSFRVGSRDAYDANVFMRDLADRLANRLQLTSDGPRRIWTPRSGPLAITSTTPCW
jgi:hypothetical protein